ncbi:uncharacterized protein LOC116300897 [Actinia tenebrosa]|uniref:Uncharacterized protein LOC116300897 n=1 Tax=Actinia tenebrosa TaxID=6105 RepID=A0A6P8IG95_ACTTE|nr:uncharacterized protein LOC116300897 [Actinia tenebrosa]
MVFFLPNKAVPAEVITIWNTKENNSIIFSIAKKLRKLFTKSMSGDSDRVDQDLVQAPQTGFKSSPSVSIVPGPVSTSEDVPQSASFDKNISRKPRNLLIPSILVSILCFWPLGFAAIWQAAKSQRAAKSGEYENAKTHSNMAKSFIAFSVALGVLQATVMIMVVMLQLYVFPRYSYVHVEAIATAIHH